MNVAATADDKVTGSQQDWLRVRGFLNAHRCELAQAAKDLYPQQWQVAGTPLLARPEWLPGAPVPLEEVTLSWSPAAPVPDRGDGARVRRRATARRDGARFGSYAAALGALRRPALFEDRACYRLLEAQSTPAGGEARVRRGPLLRGDQHRRGRRP